MALRNAIAEHFPNATANFCIWHIDHNIVTNCKRAFASDKEKWSNFIKQWHQVVYARDEASYKTQWALLHKQLSDHAKVVKYLMKHILPLRTKFMTAWAGRTPHLGNMVSSRGESAHSWLKSHFNSSRVDFATLFHLIASAVDHRLDTILHSLAVEETQGLACLPNAFKSLHTKISVHALKQAVDQYNQYLGMKKKKPEEIKPCTGTLRAGMGIPCKHRINEIMEAKGEITASEFHLQWQLQYNPDEPVSNLFLYFA